MLQCLVVTLPFLGMLFGVDFAEARGPVTAALKRLLEVLRRAQGAVIVPNDFVDIFIEQCRGRFVKGRQEDSAEVTQALLDLLSEEHLAPERARRRAAARDALEVNSDESDGGPRPRVGVAEDEFLESPITRLFGGHFRSQMTCDVCNESSSRLEYFGMLDVELPQDGSDVSLSDCFEAMFAAERLTGDNLWHCPACRRNVNATKKLSLTELWPVVVITLKRFKVNPLGQLEKLMTSVAFPTELDFDPMLPPGAPHGLYDLVGIVNQWGSLRAGHYTAATLHDGEWFDFNDRTFKPMEGPLSPSQSAFSTMFPVGTATAWCRFRSCRRVQPRRTLLLAVLFRCRRLPRLGLLLAALLRRCRRLP